MPVKPYKIALLLACFLILASIQCGAQEPFVITGVVTNESGDSLSGVSVSIEDALIDPVITDQGGFFRISAPSHTGWLIVSPVDTYKSKRIYINMRDHILVHLAPMDMGSANDELLYMFRPEQRRNMVSAVEDGDPGRFPYVPNQTVDQSLQGSIAGNFSTQRSGLPASGAVSFLRGVKSMNTNNQPLYVIDGIPIEPPGVFRSNLDGFSYNPLTSLDPNDVANISVIKDFEAGALYGVRGSNGVVLIETLKATDVSARAGVTMAPQQLPQIDATQYKTLANEILLSSGANEEEFPYEYPGLYTVDPDPGYFRYMHNTSWQNEVFGNSLFSDYYIRVRGGDQIARYGLSVGYLNHKGIVKNTGYDRLNVRFVGTFSIFKWLRMYISSNLSTANSELKESARVEETSPILSALSKTPLMHPHKFDSDGKQILAYSDVDELGVSNPAAVINSFQAENTNYRFLTSVRLEGDLSENLRLSSLIGVNFNAMDEKIFMPNHGMEFYDGGEAYNAAKSLVNSLLAIYNDNYIIYRNVFGARHGISATGGIRLNTNRNEEDWGVTRNSNENDEYRALQSGVSYLREMGGLSGKWNRLAAYGNLNYSYNDRYMLHAGITSEFSSRVGKNATTISDPSAATEKDHAGNVVMFGDQPFGLFYSMGGAWRMSSESFLKNIPWLEEIKLRLSWGSAGNDDIGNHNALRYYELSRYRETSGMIPGNITDKSLNFETSYQLNPGLDISLWSNRLAATLDIYTIRTENMLVYEPQATYTGFDLISSNEGAGINRGWEIKLFSRPVSMDDFHVDIGFNVAQIRNELLEMSNGEIVTPFPGGAFISREGESMLNFYGYNFEGVFSTSAEAAEAGLVNDRGISYGAGDARFSDLSGPGGTADGVIDQHDKTLIGSPLPKWYGGADVSLSWREWSLLAHVQFVTGNRVFNYVRSQNEKMSDLSNQSSKVLKRWHYEGHETDVPRAAWNDPAGNAAFSSRWIENGSYVRLKHITLSYRVPGKFLAFRNGEFFFTGTNLLTFTRYLGYDPEFSFSYHTMEQGIDYGLMPHTRRVMVGIKLGL